VKRIYVYPNVVLRDKSLYNPYIKDLMDGLADHFIIVNPEPSSKGILHLFSKITKTDYYYLNWIENLPERKGGLLQTSLFIVFVFLLKILGKKIIWTMHNKYSHSKRRMKLKRYLSRFMIRHSDYIVTHSSEGIRFAERISPKVESRIIYLPHPVKDYNVTRKEEPEIDILIWGLIAPYKGIDVFLDLLYQKKMEHEFKIQIAGKVVEDSYLSKIEQYTNQNINLENRFLSFEELSDLIPASRMVIFPYQKDSILSSGVLMDTIANRGKVLGPDIAAFADLKEVGIIETYSDFEDMINKIRKIIAGEVIVKDDQLNDFIDKNSWKQFVSNLKNWIEN
jgi:glycosyltransferase involved in cell wall biosynthesis